MKKSFKEQASKLQIYLLAGLILIFFGILFLSTAFKNISTEYTFQEEITTTSSSFNIGQITISNKAPITAKMNLKTIKVCDIKDPSKNLNLNYIGESLTRYNSYGRQSIEISGKTTETIILSVDYYYFDTYDKYGNNIKHETPINLDLHVFELTENDDEYSYCKIADKKTAIANIQVTITE